MGIEPRRQAASGLVFAGGRHPGIVDIQPASIDQVQSGRDGRTRLVTADVGGVAKQLHEIDRSLKLRLHEHTGHYSVIQVFVEHGQEVEHLITTCQPVAGTVDPRLPERIRKIMQPSYDVVDEITRLNDQRRADLEHREAEEIGERSERAHHAFRRAVGDTSRIVVPR